MLLVGAILPPRNLRSSLRICYRYMGLLPSILLILSAVVV